MRAQKQTRKKPRMGRPPKLGASRYSIRITDAVAKYYRKLGDGNLTLGIERAASNQRDE